MAILVNAAGLDGFKRFANLTFEDWQRVIDVNLHGVFHMTQAVLPDMVEAGWGRIVNISSSSTHSGAPYMSHYVAANPRSTAHQFAGPRVRPQRRHRQRGAARIHRHPDAARRREQRGFLGDIDETIARTPVRRIGKPEDIAAACAFLISEEAGYITGQILGVNGGRNT